LAARLYVATGVAWKPCLACILILLLLSTVLPVALLPWRAGEHKISRGFIPVPTRSFHHVRDTAFRRAIADYLQKEGEWMENYRQQLEDLEPFRAPVAL
jgi:hypothetical protein